MALLLTGCQGLWLHRLLYDLGLNLFKTPTLILMDNQGALDLSKDNWHHQHTKHINIMHYFIHKHVKDNTFNVVHIPGDQNQADGFTKPLSKD